MKASTEVPARGKIRCACISCLSFEVEMLVVPKVSYDFIAEACSPGVSLELEEAQVKPLSPIN